MPTQEELAILIRARDEASRKVKDLDQQIHAATGSMRRDFKALAKDSRTAGLVLSGLGAAGLLTGKQLVDAAREQINSERVLAQVVENSGERWSDYRERVLAATAALQRKTNFGDEEQLRVMARIVTITGDVNRAMRALPLVLDAAEVSGQNLNTISNTLTRALTGEVNQARSLGITFEETASFGERLAIVQSAVGGAAQANVDPFTQLGNTIGDLKETLGRELIPLLTPLLQGLTGFVERLQALNPTMVRAAVVIGSVGTAVALISGPILLFIGFIPQLVAGFRAIAVGASIAKAAMGGPVSVAITLVAITTAATATIAAFRELDKSIQATTQSSQAYIDATRPLADLEKRRSELLDQAQRIFVEQARLEREMDQLEEQRITTGNDWRRMAERKRDLEKELIPVEAELKGINAALAQETRETTDAMAEQTQAVQEARREFVSLSSALYETAQANRAAFDRKAAALAQEQAQAVQQWATAGANANRAIAEFGQQQSAYRRDAGNLVNTILDLSKGLDGQEYLLRLTASAYAGLRNGTLTAEDAHQRLLRILALVREELDQQREEAAALEQQYLATARAQAALAGDRGRVASAIQATREFTDPVAQALFDRVSRTEDQLRKEGIATTGPAFQRQFFSAVEQAMKQGMDRSGALMSMVRQFERLLGSGRAGGGMASGLTLVGERGPELVNLGRGGMVYPSGSGPGGISITVQGSVLGTDLSDIVAQALVQARRRGANV